MLQIPISKHRAFSQYHYWTMDRINITLRPNVHRALRKLALAMRRVNIWMPVHRGVYCKQVRGLYGKPYNQFSCIIIHSKD